MEQKRIKLKDLVQNTGQIEGLPANPRQWTRDELDKLKASITETPELLEARGIIVYPHNGQFVAMGGNMRLAALTEMGEKDAPCIVLPADTTIDKLKEIVIKDNGAFGKHDWDALANEWSDLPLTDWGIPVWENEEEKTDSGAAREDDFDEEKDAVEARCEKGDIWQLGEHRLMCGDSTSVDDIKRLMGGDLADMWLTDPPYNVDYEGGTKEHLKIENDKKNDSEFAAFLAEAYMAANGGMRDGAAFYIWHADSEGYNFRKACVECGWKVRECLIWVKNSLVLGRQDYQWKHEPCLYGWKGGAGHNWYSDRKQTTILEFDRPQRSTKHPTMKPVSLFAYLMKNSTPKKGIVLDSFGGSGTTIIAAEQLGRKARVMELSPHYCDVIIARWEKETGAKAERI